MKKSALEWLVEKGTLPTTSVHEFAEQNEELKTVRKENETYKENEEATPSDTKKMREELEALRSKVVKMTE